MFGTTATLAQTRSGAGSPFPRRGRLAGPACPASRKFTDRQQSLCPDVPAAGSHGNMHPTRWGSRISGQRRCCQGRLTPRTRSRVVQAGHGWSSAVPTNEPF